MFLDKIMRLISLELANTEEGQNQFRRFHEMTKHPGWKVYQSIVVTLANSMAQYMVSKEFAVQKPEEKDREQWAIYLSKEVIEFLLDPIKHSRFKQAVEFHNQAMEATLPKKGATRKVK